MDIIDNYKCAKHVKKVRFENAMCQKKQLEKCDVCSDRFLFAIFLQVIFFAIFARVAFFCDVCSFFFASFVLAIIVQMAFFFAIFVRVAFFGKFCSRRFILWFLFKSLFFICDDRSNRIFRALVLESSATSISQRISASRKSDFSTSIFNCAIAKKAILQDITFFFIRFLFPAHFLRLLFGGYTVHVSNAILLHFFRCGHASIAFSQVLE